MSNSHKSRNSSFELLRLILMFLIIIHHCIVHGLGLSGLSRNFSTELVIPNTQMWIAFGINGCCICAVNCFILISGYFKIKVTAKKLINLVLTLLFYSLLLTIIPYIIINNWTAALKYSLFLSQTPYWFVLDYIFLMVFVPIINLAFESLPKIQRYKILIGLIIMNCYFGFIWGNNVNINGYTIMQFIIMYWIGREIAKTDINFSRLQSIVIYLFSSLLVGLIGWLLWYHNYFELAWKSTYYNNPLLIVSSVSLFLFFKTINFNSEKINRLAVSALGIYLFQSSIAISHILYTTITDLSFQWPHAIWLLIIFFSIIIIIFSLVFDKFRIKIVNKLESKIIKNL